jgi:hypothetical protein
VGGIGGIKAGDTYGPIGSWLEMDRGVDLDPRGDWLVYIPFCGRTGSLPPPIVFRKDDSRN